MINEDPAIEAHKKRIKLELMLKDSDFKKNVRSLVDMDIHLRDLKRKKIQIEMEYAQTEEHMKKLQAEQIVIQNDMKRSKNLLNNL